MNVLCILLCVAFASGFSIDNNGTYEDKIAGGDYVKIENVPYQASLLWFRIVNCCGATIIDKSWVITASHCVKNTWAISVRTGSGYRNKLGKVYKSEKIIIHADYDTKSENNDIALIKLAEPIKFNNEQQSIRLAKRYDIPREGELMRISGFGMIGERLSNSDILKAAYVPVINQEHCKKIFNLEPITDNMFCAGNGDADACNGDSGGPGVIHGKLYGIISSGANCESKLFPGVYTRVPRYYDWIKEKTGLKFKNL